MADARWVVNGDRYNIVLDQHFEEDPYAFKLNAARGQTDIFHRETPPGTSGGSLKGIYRISGDSLAVCYHLTALQFPKSCDAGAGSRRVLYQFERERS